MPDIKDTKEVSAAPAEVAVNSQKPGDVKVRVKADTIRHNDVAYAVKTILWMDKDAADYHVAQGSVERA